MENTIGVKCLSFAYRGLAWGSKKKKKITTIVKLPLYHDDDDVYRINRYGVTNENHNFWENMQYNKWWKQKLQEN